MLNQASLASFYNAPDAPAMRLWHAVREAEPGCEMLAVNASNYQFPVLEYLSMKGVSQDVLEGMSVERNQHSQVRVSTSIHHLASDPDVLEGGHGFGSLQRISARREASHVDNDLQNGMISLVYEGKEFHLYIFTYQSCSSEEQLFILAWNTKKSRLQSDHRAGHQLVAQVYAWASQLHKEIWVYNGTRGGWRKDKKFFTSVVQACEDDLVLPQDILMQVYRDTTSFFDSKPLYVELNIAWKRGILLLGPPGNGKTGLIRVLAKKCIKRGIPSLYVETANTCAGTEYGMMAIFEKARSLAPCMLVLEDIETLVSGNSRTVLLNQLDGMESNDGILVIATANDVSKLDGAILQRPSRFDAKYKFELPDYGLRERFIRHWITNKVGLDKLSLDAFPAVGGEQALTTVDQLVEKLATLTNGWSFAFLKELFISFLLSEAAKVSSASDLDDMDGVGIASLKVHVRDLLAQVHLLQKQVANVEQSDTSDEDTE